MAKFIFGSGLIALLARKMLGPTYQLIPFGKSRFYSFNPPTADNFIICNPSIDYCLNDMFGPQSKYSYRRSYSVGGNLIPSNNDILSTYLVKTCDFDPPPHAAIYYKSQDVMDVYGLRCTDLYTKLVEEYKDEIGKSINTYSTVTGLTNDHIEFSNGKIVEYDEVVNTIPMNVLLDLMKVQHSLKANPVHIIHLTSSSIDLEMYNQVFVVDPQIDFYKVTRIDTNRYLFYFLNDHVSHGIYLMGYINGPFDILDGTRIDNYIIKGGIPKWSHPKIKNIGSYAQWDDCMDVGSCIYRLYLSKL